MRIRSNLPSTKREIVAAMLERGVTPGLAGASPRQQEALQTQLGNMDRGVLLWAQQQGVRLQVLQAGEELEGAQALRDLSGRFEERIQPQTVEQIHQHLAPLSEQIRSCQDPDGVARLRRQKCNELAELLTVNACGAAVFTPAFAPLLAPGLSQLLADPNETPTLKGLALHHGADSPEEQSQFYGWMEKLNGTRLQEARQESIEERSRLLESNPQARQRWQTQAQEHPELVPLDTTLHTLVVPDAHFFSGKSDSATVLLDRSDLRSIEGWRNGDFRGQWFFLEGKKNVVIRDSAVDLATPVHEFGHVVDMTLEREAPEFYGSLRPQIERAHGRARSEGKAISHYALANRREYIAEGFANYYLQPEKLRRIDPELYRLVDTMAGYCCQRFGVERG